MLPTMHGAICPCRRCCRTCTALYVRVGDDADHAQNYLYLLLECKAIKRSRVNILAYFSPLTFQNMVMCMSALIKCQHSISLNNVRQQRQSTQLHSLLMLLSYRMWCRNLIDCYQCFTVTYCLHLQNSNVIHKVSRLKLRSSAFPTKFEVLTEAAGKTTVLLNMTPCSLIKVS